MHWIDRFFFRLTFQNNRITTSSGGTIEDGTKTAGQRTIRGWACFFVVCGIDKLDNVRILYRVVLVTGLDVNGGAVPVDRC